MRPNVLFVTLDQFRAECLSSAGHPVVCTPHLDALAAAGVRFARHYSQAAPCGPGRASLYTGTYQLNHRVVTNGTPLDARFDNVAFAARRAGYQPALFGYTDQTIDPRTADGPDDPRLLTYNGVLPGFEPVLDIPDDQGPWLEWLAGLGYDTSPGPGRLLATEDARPEAHSVGAFLTDRAIDWLERQRQPWFAHLSYLRPHPPFCAPGDWSTVYDPARVGAELGPAIPVDDDPHWFHRAALGIPRTTAPTDPAELDRVRAQYFGMVSHVDHQLGRVFAALRSIGAWDHTVVVVTSDHGEGLGEHGEETHGYFVYQSSLAVPLLLRGPGIAPGETFTYRFPIVQSGTYWYHSHTDFQEPDGAYGAIVIEPKDREPFRFDRDYVVQLADAHPHPGKRKDTTFHRRIAYLAGKKRHVVAL